jgi:hypothetical protein
MRDGSSSPQLTDASLAHNVARNSARESSSQHGREVATVARTPSGGRQRHDHRSLIRAQCRLSEASTAAGRVPLGTCCTYRAPSPRRSGCWPYDLEWPHFWPVPGNSQQARSTAPQAATSLWVSACIPVHHQEDNSNAARPPRRASWVRGRPQQEGQVMRHLAMLI